MGSKISRTLGRTVAAPFLIIWLAAMVAWELFIPFIFPVMALVIGTAIVAEALHFVIANLIIRLVLGLIITVVATILFFICL